MASTPHRLLGFAFACADLLVEIDAAGRIAFAVGDAKVLAGRGEASLVGKPWRSLVDERDQALVAAVFEGLEHGERQGPVIARIAPTPGDAPQAFSLSACRLPQNGGAVSCALGRAAAPAVMADGELLDRVAFEAITKSMIEQARNGGHELELAFVEMEGLTAAVNAMPSDGGKALRAKLAGALRAQSHGGSAAAELGEDRFALVRDAGEAPEVLTARLSRLLALSAQTGDIRLAARAMALDGEVSPARVLRAIRYALDAFLREGVAAETPVNLTEAVHASVRQTLERANELGAVVSEGRFNLVFQPVVTVKTGALHHHEVLVRFGDDASPFPMIRMAEELDLIEGLDRAIIGRTLAELKASPQTRLAVNVSGRTIISPGFIADMEALLKPAALDGRLMFEVTESAAIEDLELADRHIQVLRGLGCQVCLDDFGAGAASLAYLQQLSLDVVKIDGRYIRELQHGGRQSAFIRHLVKLCGELKVKTLAEMVETPAAEDAVRRAGVDFAQGWLYGAATDRPEKPAVTQKAAARRAGAVEAWA